jgi:hypothetical protein
MHTLYYYGLLFVFCVVAYMMVVDKNVADYIILSYKLFLINVERLRWLIIYHPKNPITRWWMDRKFKKFIKEMQDNSQTGPSE